MVRDKCCLLPAGHAVCVAGTLCNVLRICSGLVDWYLVYDAERAANVGLRRGCLVLEYSSTAYQDRGVQTVQGCALESVLYNVQFRLCLSKPVHGSLVMLAGRGEWRKNGRQVFCTGCWVGLEVMKGKQKCTIVTTRCT